MKRGLKRVLCVSAFLLVSLVALLVWRPWVPSGPVYQGKILTAWVEQWSTNHKDFGPATDERRTANQEAEFAIRQIGTNGIPFPLGLMGKEESAAKKLLHAIVPDALNPILQLEDNVRGFKWRGAFGLAALGTNAGPAVAELMRLLSVEVNRNPPDPTGGYLPLLTLGYLGNTAAPAIPMLAQCLTNQESTLRMWAAYDLGLVHRQPELVVPALLTYLDALPPQIYQGRDVAITSIGEFGTNSSTASPVLVELLTNPNPHFRRIATNWLQTVDPAAAERAGIPIERNR